MSAKHINLFVTVPVDLEDEGYQIGAYVVELNRIYASRGITIDITLLEEDDPDPDISADDAADSDYFYVLLYRHSDSTAIDCFNKAIDFFRTNERPKIYTYFREIPEGSSAEQGVLDFMHSLDEEMGHFYSLFSSVDSIKLDLLLEIARDFQAVNSLNTHDGFLFADGNVVLDLDSVPPYARNERLQYLREQRDEIDSQMRKLEGSSSDTGRRMELANLSIRRKTTLDEIEQIEQDTLNVAIRLLSSTSTTNAMSKRINEARKLFQQGDIKSARAILEDDEIERERDLRRRAREALLAQLERNRAEEQSFVESRLILIDLIRAEGLSKSSDKKTLTYYKQCFDSTIEWDLDPNFIPDYISYLHENRHFDVFDAIDKKAIDYTLLKFEENPQKNTHAYIGSVMQIGFGYIRKSFEGEAGAAKAERLYLDVLPIAKQRSTDTAAYTAKRDYAMLLNYYGIALIDQQKYEAAYSYLRESIKIGREVIEFDLSFRRNLAVSCNSLALCFYRDHNITQEALDYVEESVRLRHELYLEDDNRFEAMYAQGVYVSGALYRRGGYLEKAEMAFIDSIKMLKRLSLALPDRAESLLASAEAGYSKLLIRTERYDEALPLLEDARLIRMRWCEKYPDTYGRPLLFVLQKLERVYAALGNTKDAETTSREIEELEARTQTQADLPDSD